MNHKKDNRTVREGPLTSKEEQIYKFQLILNYLSKKDARDKLAFINNELNLTSDFGRTVTETLRNVLTQRQVKG